MDSHYILNPKINISKIRKYAFVIKYFAKISALPPDLNFVCLNVPLAGHVKTQSAFRCIRMTGEIGHALLPWSRFFLSAVPRWKVF